MAIGHPLIIPSKIQDYNHIDCFSFIRVKLNIIIVIFFSYCMSKFIDIKHNPLFKDKKSLRTQMQTLVVR